MTESSPAHSPASDLNHVPKPKSRTKLLVLAIATALVLTGGITTTVIATSAYAAETEELCTAALVVGKTSRDAADMTLGYADGNIEVLELSEPLAKDRGALAQYVERPAVEAVEAVEGTDDKPAVKAVAARPSGEEHLKAVEDDRAAVDAVDVATECTDRDTAEAIHAGAKKLDAASDTLKESAKALLDDFTVFREEVAAEIAAEKKAAAEKAATEEAARIAAEQAAAEEAARIAAEQAAWEAQQQQQQYWAPSQDTGYVGGGEGGSTGGGGGGGGTNIPPPPGMSHTCPTGWNCAL